MKKSKVKPEKKSIKTLVLELKAKGTACKDILGKLSAMGVHTTSKSINYYFYHKEKENGA
jgi:hypothetical protein